MTAPHLFAHCSDALCVAEDTAVSFFSQKGLKKFRVERFSGARICGLYVQRGLDGSHLLHVVDADAHWYVVSLREIAMVSSSTIRFGAASAVEDGAGGPTATSEGMAQPRPVISRARRGLRGTAAHDDGQYIAAAHFHQTDGDLYCVLLTPGGVREVMLRSAGELHARDIMHFTHPMRDTIMAVGDRTGLVVVGQLGQKWMQCSRFCERDANRNVPHRFTLGIALQSLACSPVSDAVAVGGVRGELAVYPSADSEHYFSDHWHHTALTALNFSVDGSSLFTGALESVLLVWNLSSYTHKKITCDLGAIRCIVPSRSTGSTLLLACATSTLMSVDLLQMKVQHSIEGIEWAAGVSCTGLVVDHWMGQPAVMLTGLPSVLRVCDPVTQQSIYSLHISSQMETIPSPPHHGIRFAGVLRGGRVMVTYEFFAGTHALPPLLRFWVYEPSLKRHVETQTIFSPHTSEVRALQVDRAGGRVFTMCRDTIKAWEEVREEATDAFATEKRSWRNQSSSPTPSQEASAMMVSPDGSLCLVADDCVHVYAVARCGPGVRWPLIQTLTQAAGTEALRDLVLLPQCKVVAARDSRRVFLWDLATSRAKHVFDATATGEVTALCGLTDDTVLAADGASTLVELNSTGVEMQSVEHGNSHCIRYMQALPGDDRSVAVVDDVTGFRVLHVPTKAKKAEVQVFSGDADGGRHTDATEAEVSVLRYFGDHSLQTSTAVPGSEQALLDNADRTAKANRWLADVLQESAYAVPPMSSVLSLYLRRRTTGGVGSP